MDMDRVNKKLNSLKVSLSNQETLITILKKYFPHAIETFSMEENGTFSFKLFENQSFYIFFVLASPITANEYVYDINKNLILLSKMSEKRINLLGTISQSNNLLQIPELIIDIANIYDENVDKLLDVIKYFKNNSQYFQKGLLTNNNELLSNNNFYNTITGNFYYVFDTNEGIIKIVFNFYLRNNDELVNSIINFKVLKNSINKLIALNSLQ